MNAAAAKVARVWSDAGVCPEAHRLAQEKLLREWEPATQLTVGWVRQITDLLNPLSLELIGPCPAYKQDRFTDGQGCSSSALRASARIARCQVCDAEWNPGQFLDLASQLGARK